MMPHLIISISRPFNGCFEPVSHAITVEVNQGLINASLMVNLLLNATAVMILV